MGSSKVVAVFLIVMFFMLMSLPPLYACGYCTRPHPPSCGPPSRPSRPKGHHSHPPHHGHRGGHRHKGGPPPSKTPPMPPIVLPPIIVNPPPVIAPPVVLPPPSSGHPPYHCPPSPGGGHGSPPAAPGSKSPQTPQPTCPIDALKLGACVDVLGGLVHIGLGNPVENVCCPVIKGLLELEAAICLCTTIRLKLLNLNIFIPLALQALITCGKTPPPGFVCPPL